MSKINLLVSESDMNSFCSEWFKPCLEKFNLVYYDETKNYDKKSTILVVGNISNSGWYTRLYNQGYKVVVDNLWELPQKIELDAYICKNKNWFWYNESLWYRYRNLHNYVPNPAFNKLAFIPMNLQKNFRDQLFKIISQNPDQFIFSYRALGFTLPGDIDAPEWQRYFNADWYNQTYFSVVAETTIDQNIPLFITEKTFKPIAFQHPFMILGQPKILKWLHYLGFETFENLFDESYDQIFDLDKKLAIIEKNIFNFEKKLYDSITIEKLRHNHNLFFDYQQVLNRIKEEIVNPIISYAEL